MITTLSEKAGITNVILTMMVVFAVMIREIRPTASIPTTKTGSTRNFGHLKSHLMQAERHSSKKSNTEAFAVLSQRKIRLYSRTKPH